MGDSIWELLGVGDEVARRVPAGRPAVVQDHIFVSQVLEAKRNNPLRRIENDCLVEFTGERIPGVLYRNEVSRLSPACLISLEAEERRGEQQ